MPDGSEETSQKQQDQVQVNMDALTKKMGKYALVTVVAKRASDIRGRQARQPGGDALDNAVTLALSDVAGGRVKVIKEKEAE